MGLGNSVIMSLIDVVIFVIIEWLGRRNNYAIESFLVNKPTPLRWAMYYAFIIAIVLSYGEKQDFIYFQF